jgi:2-phospho-L-lactate/phosphoenolpyruvate guanylyltransferase
VLTVIPFRAGGKSRLPRSLRRDLALAMLDDVARAALELGPARIVTDDVDAADRARALGAVVVADPGGGQGAAVGAGLEGAEGRCLVVNADVPCATPDALRRLARCGDALVAAADGTTNALALADCTRFEPLYGPGSASRFGTLGLVRVSIPELEADVDTLDDLERISLPVGRRTTLVSNQHNVVATRAR